MRFIMDILTLFSLQIEFAPIIQEMLVNKML